MAEDRDLITKKYGNKLPYDRNFRGPQWRNRSCTDVPCLFIFIIFLGAWGFIANYAVRNGDLNKLMVPTDNFNRKCGVDSQVLDKKYLFFFNLDKCIDPLVPITGCPTPQVCVKQCPTETFNWDTMKDTLSFDEIKRRLICLTDADFNNIKNKEDAGAAIAKERCARYYVKSAPFLNRCIWEFSSKVCEYLPSYFSSRTKRDSYNSTALVNTFNKPLNSEIEAHSQALVPSEEVECKRSSEQRNSVIKEKMLHTAIPLAMLVGNMMSNFYNGTHDTQKMGEAIVEDMLNS